MKQLAGSVQSQARASPAPGNRRAAELSTVEGRGPLRRLPGLSGLLHHWRMSNLIRIQTEADFEGLARS